MRKAEQLYLKMEKVLWELRANYRGHRQWLLDSRQLARYRDWQAKKTKIIEQYEPDGYYAAYLNGTATELPELPVDLERALQLTPPPSIPLGATEAQAQRQYEDYIR